MRLKKINNNQYDKHLNYDVRKLRLNPEGTLIGEEIKMNEMIEDEERQNNKQISSWGKKEHREFNKKIWNKAKNLMGDKQVEKFPIGENKKGKNNQPGKENEIENEKKLV